MVTSQEFDPFGLELAYKKSRNTPKEILAHETPGTTPAWLEGDCVVRLCTQGDLSAAHDVVFKGLRPWSDPRFSPKWFKHCLSRLRYGGLLTYVTLDNVTINGDLYDFDEDVCEKGSAEAVVWMVIGYRACGGKGFVSLPEFEFKDASSGECHYTSAFKPTETNYQFGPAPPQPGCAQTNDNQKFLYQRIQGIVTKEEGDERPEFEAVPSWASFQCPSDTSDILGWWFKINKLYAEMGTFGHLVTQRGIVSHPNMLVSACQEVVATAATPRSTRFVEDRDSGLHYAPGNSEPESIRHFTPAPFGLAESVLEVYPEIDVFVPRCDMYSVIEDLNYDNHSKGSPWHPAELRVGFELLNNQLFKKLHVTSLEDQDFAPPDSHCGPGFPPHIKQDQLGLTIADASQLIGRPFPSASRPTGKVVPAGKARLRTVAGLDCLTTGVGKVLTKPAQLAIVRCTQSDDPGLSAVGLSKDAKSVNTYFQARTHGKAEVQWMFGADHTKCDRTVVELHGLMSYCALATLSGFEVTPELLVWILNTFIRLPMAGNGFVAFGRRCESSGDPATCHTNTIYNAMVHVAVLMRSLVSYDGEDEWLKGQREAVMDIYGGGGDITSFYQTWFEKELTLVLYSDDGLVIGHSKNTQWIFSEENWAQKLGGITGLDIDPKKSESKGPEGGIEFLGCRLYKDGTWFLATEPERMARALLVTKHGTSARWVESAIGVLTSYANCMLKHKREYEQLYEMVQAAVTCMEVEAGGTLYGFPTLKDLHDLATGEKSNEVEFQSAKICPCGVAAHYSCSDCPVSVWLCATHAYQHFSTTTHQSEGRQCRECGNTRLTDLSIKFPAKNGSVYVCTACCEEGVKMAGDGRMILGEEGAPGTRCIGTLDQWVLHDHWWCVLGVNYRVLLGQQTCFQQKYPRGTADFDNTNFKVGERLQVKLKGQWCNAVYTTEGWKGPKGVLSGVLPVRPDLGQLTIRKEDLQHLESGVYIQGPPGCGKSYTAIQLIKHAVANNKSVNYASSSNAMVHEMLNLLAEESIEAHWCLPRHHTYAYPATCGPQAVVHIGTLGCLKRPAELVLIDEVSLAVPSQVVNAARFGRRVVILGDHQQLAPVTEPRTVWDPFWPHMAEHRQLTHSYRYGETVAKMITHLYDCGVTSATSHDTVVSILLPEQRFEEEVDITLVAYNHELREQCQTIDSAQGLTFDSVLVDVKVSNSFTTFRPRVLVALTRARKRLTIRAPEEWFRAVGSFINWDAIPGLTERFGSFRPQSAEVPTIYQALDIEFAHCFRTGQKNFLAVGEFGIVRSDGTTAKGFCAPRAPGDALVEKWMVPSRWRYMVRPLQLAEEMQAYTWDKFLRELNKANVTILWNGGNDKKSLEPYVEHVCECQSCEFQPPECQHPGCEEPSTVISEKGKTCSQHAGTHLSRLLRLKVINFQAGKLEVEHAHCPIPHGLAHHALADAEATLCHVAQAMGLCQRPEVVVPGFWVQPKKGSCWTFRGGFLTSEGARSYHPLRACALKHSDMCSTERVLKHVQCSTPPCVRCARLDQTWETLKVQFPGHDIGLRFFCQTSIRRVTGLDTVPGPTGELQLVVKLSCPPYQVRFFKSVEMTLERVDQFLHKPLPVAQVVRGLGLYGCEAPIADLPILPPSPVTLHVKTRPSTGYLVTWQKVDENSLAAEGAQHEVDEVLTFCQTETHVPFWLTKFEAGKTVPIQSLFTTGRLHCTFDFHEDLSDPMMTHCFKGEHKGMRITGIHHVSSDELDWRTMRVSDPAILGTCNLKGGTKYNTTVLDVPAKPFTRFVRREWDSMATLSRVVKMNVDFHEVVFMLWKNVTCYPTEFRIQMVEIPPSRTGLPLTYHLGRTSPQRFGTYAKGLDLASFITKGLRRPKKDFRVLVFGAAGKDKTAPMTKAIRSCLQTKVDSYDIADFDDVDTDLHGGRIESVEGTYHLVVSDAFVPESDPAGREKLISDLNELLEDHVCYGGCALIKFNRTCPNYPYKYWCSLFGSWTRVYSSCMSQSSETFLVLKGRLPTPGKEPTVNPYNFAEYRDTPLLPSEPAPLHQMQVIPVVSAQEIHVVDERLFGNNCITVQ